VPAVLAAELWQANCSIIPWAVVYHLKTPAHLGQRATRWGALGRALLLALGLAAGACLNPKTDDLPVEGENPGNPPDNSGSGLGGSSAVGAAGTAGTAGGAGTGSGGGAAGAGGAGADDGDAGVPADADAPLDDSTLSQDGGDAGTQ
jgi:hypothetical protein